MSIEKILKFSGTTEIEYTNSRVRITALDGIRGLAALVVLFGHFLFSWGWIGVDLFFVLSGFLITSILLDTKTQRNYFKNFYTKRILRIFPLYYLAILLVFILEFFFLKKYNLYSVSVSKLFYYYNFEWALSKPRTSVDLLGQFWSLAIEEQFYLFFPFFIFYANDKSLKRFLRILIISAIVIRLVLLYNGFNYPIPYAFTFCRMDALLIGAYTAVYVREKKHFYNLLFYFLFFASIIFLLIGNKANSIGMMTFGYTILDLFFAYTILKSLSKNSPLKYFFNSALLVQFGKYSYGIYVYHPIIIGIWYLNFFPIMENSFQHVGHRVLFLVSTIICFIITMMIAYLSYHLFEKKFLRLCISFAPAVTV